MSEAGLDDVVDYGEAVVKGDERAFGGVDGEPADVLPCPAEGIGASGELFRQGGVAHQTVVCVDGYPIVEVAQLADGVLGYGCRRPRVHIGSGADFQRDAPVSHKGGEVAEFGSAVGVDLDFVNYSHAVSEPFGAAELNGFPDRRRAVAFASVDGEVEVVPLDVMEGIKVSGGRIACFFAGDVKTDHDVVSPFDGKLGDLQRMSESAHGGEQHSDANGVGSCAGSCAFCCCCCAFIHALFEACDDCFNYLIMAETFFGVKLGGKADFGIDDAIGGKVFGALFGHPMQGFRGLHYADGVGESLKIEIEAATVGAPHEMTGQLL